MLPYFVGGVFAIMASVIGSGIMIGYLNKKGIDTFRTTVENRVTTVETKLQNGRSCNRHDESFKRVYVEVDKYKAKVDNLSELISKLVTNIEILNERLRVLRSDDEKQWIAINKLTEGKNV